MIRPFLGLRDPLFALSLVAIDPGLKGVMIGGPPGTGKTVLVRAARRLWPAGTPFVELPLNCTVDRLIGGIDLERSCQVGHPVVMPGLLAQAHGGVLFVDEINLLPPEIAHIVLQALSREEVLLEREGLSHRYPARFVLVGTFNPEEAPLSPVFTESVAFTVSTRTLPDWETRAFLAQKAGREIVLPEDIPQSVDIARRVLPQVQLAEKALRELCAVATRTGVIGNRAEIFAVRCARANAALHKRVPVTRGDVDLAIRLVYLPRVGESVLPGSAQQADASLNRRREEQASTSPAGSDGATSGEIRDELQPQTAAETKAAQETQSRRQVRQWEEMIFRNELEELRGFGGELPELRPVSMPKQRDTGKAVGRHRAGVNLHRGRHLRSVPGDPRRGRLDLYATLKAAALAAPLRRKEAAGKIPVRKEDFRIKQFRRRSGLLFIFVVDASGSMALNHLTAARKAALSLLEKAYIHRDKVALITFRGEEAEVVLSPGGGISRASRALQVLRTGGRTPLSAALLKAWEIAAQAQQRWGVAGSVLVLFTDGRANQPLIPVVDKDERKQRSWEEIFRISGKLREVLAAAMVFDVRIMFVPGGRGQRLAEWLGAHYIHLTDKQVQPILETVQATVNPLR